MVLNEKEMDQVRLEDFRSMRKREHREILRSFFHRKPELVSLAD